PADLTVVAVRAEHRVDPPEPAERALDVVVVETLVADVDHDRHPHDLCDRGAHAFRAFRIAACSEPTNASLVRVASETRSTFALCARSASLRRIGIAFSLMYWDR